MVSQKSSLWVLLAFLVSCKKQACFVFLKPYIHIKFERGQQYHHVTISNFIVQIPIEREVYHTAAITARETVYEANIDGKDCENAYTRLWIHEFVIPPPPAVTTVPALEGQVPFLGTRFKFAFQEDYSAFFSFPE